VTNSTTYWSVTSDVRMAATTKEILILVLEAGLKVCILHIVNKLA
jgi:hypothetical protein